MTKKGRSQHQFLHDLPESFRHERQDLIEAELDNWQALCQLGDLQLSQIVRKGRSSARNLHRLRGMAALVCELDIAPQDAALLMHAGIASSKRSPGRLHTREAGPPDRASGTISGKRKTAGGGSAHRPKVDRTSQATDELTQSARQESWK